MAVKSAGDLMLYELSGLYQAEKQIAQMLPTLIEEVTDEDLKQGLQAHALETEQQILNLEQCFQILGEQPQDITCHTIEGLKQDHDTFVQENPDPQLLTGFILGAAAKTEHFEIACYRGAVEKATLMGQQECATLLQENLEQEEEMGRKIEEMARQLGQQMIDETELEPTGALA